MAHDGHVLDLVTTIYDAAADPALWPVFLEHFAEAVSGSTTSLFSYNAAHMHKYTEHHAGIDCWGVHGRKLIVPGAVFLGQQLCPDGVLKRSEFGAGSLRPMSAFHEFCGIISVDASAATVIASLRPRERGPFDDSDTLLLKSLMPHLQRALALQKRIAALENSVASATDVHLRFILPAAQQPAAAAVISDPESQFGTPVQTLGRLFALSRAEARLAAVLVKGYSLREAAEELGVSLSTVRTHLKRLFEKTGTNRQATLIRAFLVSPARLLSNFNN
jgi:DNA-binding CsgD family transcriptional regulator